MAQQLELEITTNAKPKEKDPLKEERNWHTVDEYKTYLFDGYGRILGQIKMNNDGNYDVSYYPSPSIGTYLNLESAKAALIKVFTSN